MATRTIWNPKDDTREEVPDTDPRIQAYDALGEAIKRIAKAQYKAAGSPKGKPGEPAFIATGQDIDRMVKARGDVLSGSISPEEAMAMLHEPDILRERTKSPVP